MIVRAVVTSFLIFRSLLDAQSARVESRDGSHHAIVEREGNAKRWPEVNSWKASVYERDRKLYEIAKEIPFDQQFPAVQISDGGGSVLSFSFEGREIGRASCRERVCQYV